MFVPLLQACSWFAGPTPTGTLLAVQEVDRQPQAVLVDVATGERTPLSLSGDATFPGPPDPRGTHLLIVRTEEGPEGHRETLLLAPREGGEPQVLAPSAEMVRNPSFSPDGRFIVFESSAQSFRDLYRVDRDGTEPTRLTDAPHGSFEPAVSPDGTAIVFASSRDGNAEIYRMNVDGSDVQRLTDSREDDTRPGWLPDGRIAWLRQTGASKLVWRMDADGAHAHEPGDRGARCERAEGAAPRHRLRLERRLLRVRVRVRVRASASRSREAPANREASVRVRVRASASRP